MDPRVAPLAETLRLNTKLFRNCLDAMTDAQAAVRPSASTNSAAFVASHLVGSRYYLLELLGAGQANPIAQAGASKDDTAQQPLNAISAAWTAVSHALRDRVGAMNAGELDAPVTTRIPVSEPTGLNVLTFLVQHDSYHIGQLALLRKYVGLPAMRYA